MEKEKIKEKIMEHLLEFNEFILEEKNKKPYVLSVETCVPRCRCGCLLVFDNESAMGVLVFKNEFPRFLPLHRRDFAKFPLEPALEKLVTSECRNL